MQSMAVATTHDLPTLRGYWESGDLALGETLGLYPNETILRDLYAERERAKQGLLDALHCSGCLPHRVGHHASRMTMTPLLNRGMRRYIADSNSALLGLQPEDSLETIFASDGVNRLLKNLDKRRRKTQCRR